MFILHFQIVINKYINSNIKWKWMGCKEPLKSGTWLFDILICWLFDPNPDMLNAQTVFAVIIKIANCLLFGVLYIVKI